VAGQHLERPRDVAITDFCVVMLPDGVLTDRSGRTYLTYARSRRASDRARPIRDDSIPGPVRRLAEWALYTLCGGAAVTAAWFAFLLPCSCAVPSWTLTNHAPPASGRPLDAISLSRRRALDMNTLARFR
jgi:hypothetical protein